MLIGFSVYNLTSLKRTLTHLNLATNPEYVPFPLLAVAFLLMLYRSIDNDAIPALLILKKLSFFSILDTSVDVVGLRRLARAIHDEERIIDVEIPDDGERYLNCTSPSPSHTVAPRTLYFHANTPSRHPLEIPRPDPAPVDFAPGDVCAGERRGAEAEPPGACGGEPGDIGGGDESGDAGQTGGDFEDEGGGFGVV